MLRHLLTLEGVEFIQCRGWKSEWSWRGLKWRSQTRSSGMTLHSAPRIKEQEVLRAPSRSHGSFMRERDADSVPEREKSKIQCEQINKQKANWSSWLLLHNKSPPSLVTLNSKCVLTVLLILWVGWAGSADFCGSAEVGWASVLHLHGWLLAWH